LSIAGLYNKKWKILDTHFWRKIVKFD
jgi:hypothetical protein